MRQRNDERYFSGLMRLEDLDEVVSRSRMPDVRVRYLGAVERRADEAADPPSVVRAYRRGTTVVFNNVDRVWSPLGHMCRNLEHEFGGWSAANLYLAPPAARAFPPHWDPYNTFVLQLHGRKQWTIGDVVMDRPLPTQFFKGSLLMDGPLETVTLAAGDSLYIPRGLAHDVTTTGYPSLHVTVGIHPTLRIDVIKAALDLVAEHDAALRDAVLPAALDPTRCPDDATLAELLRAAAKHVDADAALGRIPDPPEAAPVSPPSGVVKAAVAGERPTATTVVRLYPRVTLDFGLTIVVLRKGEQRWRLPRRALPALQRALEGTEFTASTLPGLTPDSALRLVCHLVDNGFAHVVHAL